MRVPPALLAAVSTAGIGPVAMRMPASSASLGLCLSFGRPPCPNRAWHFESVDPPYLLNRLSVMQQVTTSATGGIGGSGELENGT